MPTKPTFAAIHALAGACTAVIMTCSREGQRLRVNIIPQVRKQKGKHDDDDADDDDANPALTTPLSICATPEELDAEFGDALTTFSTARKSVSESVAESTALMGAAEAEAKAAARGAAKKAVVPKASAAPTPAAKAPVASPDAVAAPVVEPPRPIGFAPSASPTVNAAQDALFKI